MKNPKVISRFDIARAQHVWSALDNYDKEYSFNFFSPYSLPGSTIYTLRNTFEVALDRAQRNL